MGKKHHIKIGFAGNSDVGIQHLILRYADDTYTDSYITELSVDKIRNTVIGDDEIKHQLFDPLKIYKGITPNYSGYYSNCKAIVVVFDITNRQSFEDLAEWAEEVNRNKRESCPVILVGNKADLENERKVTPEEAKKFAQEHGWIDYVEASAKTGQNVDKIFDALDQRIINQNKSQEIKDKVQEIKKSGLPIQKQLLDALDKYIERAGKDYYNFKFPFLREWRGHQRHANVETARALRQGILDGADIGVLFTKSNIEALRNIGIQKNELGTKEGYRKTGINSPELNKIIRLAQSSKEFKETKQKNINLNKN